MSAHKGSIERSGVDKMNQRRGFRVVAVLLTAILAAFCIHLYRSRLNESPPLPLWSVGFSADGKALFTAGAQPSPAQFPAPGELIVWRISDGHKRTVPQVWGVRSLAPSSNGKFIAIGKCNGSTELLDARTGQLLTSLAPHSALVNAVAVTSDSSIVASGSYDGTITLCHIAANHSETLVIPNEKVVNVAISPDGSTLVATTRSAKAVLFHLENPSSPETLDAFGAPFKGELPAEAVAFQPNGLSFATGCRTSLRIWESASGKLLRQFKQSGADILGITFSPDGATLVSVDSDGILTVWDQETGEQLHKVQAHAGPAFGVAFSPNGLLVATVGVRDYTARIWNSQSLSLTASFQRAVFRLSAR